MQGKIFDCIYMICLDDLLNGHMYVHLSLNFFKGEASYR